MRFSVRTLFICVFAAALILAAGLPLLQRITQPRHCSFVIAANSTPETFPTTNGYTILDSNDEVRFVALHKLTHMPETWIGQPSWLEVSLDSQRRPSVFIDGEFIALGSEILVYFATDQDAPRFRVLPDDAITAYEFPHQTWDRIVQTDTTDEP